ncbi:MAG: DISARM system SNF2-like helicase DrmD [Candidatus Eisenbacteria bacterium]|uniref:DISARM system SNF2-like helicase DrmD n=1 Tax=Eiseniibacteriota bacterium TaxID=2212470 RepID=A0A948RVS0_UNCEI|nr:DISARM system SNF2-like helicase DrmD [Candidatus Eisenbacteria bacterium]MBU1948291.1 DISARM system SNF2-like helicase DrmD [Candidatus Eisenbacteria bacterium]MBU2691770.1 DISARM system SNF2-like helicase DrmD [Candidatus Eisenbacteria bacterium]
MSPTQPTQIPRVGVFATIRNRRGVVTAVEPYDGDKGRLHLVHLEYKDDQWPLDERLIWELEPRGDLLEPTALPSIQKTDPMPGNDFDALLRAARWTATSPYLDPDGEGPVERLPIASPFHGAVQLEDFQLVPLLKALRMPRVNLLIADDVGLGKTIEAGLILTELLLRRRIQRVLILTPASLRLQWREAMWDKFSLLFNLIDRSETHKLRKKLGIDANPWRSFSRIIASYHYLRQPDVLEQFRSAYQAQANSPSPHLPWDLLIVDECHNLMPSPFGDDSDLCQMIRQIAPHFEHRLFLSATPHNGHTRSFTGLLEILDPVRFSQTSELKPAEKERIQQVVIRRLKREINARTKPHKFCTREIPLALPLQLSKEEIALSDAFDKFRKRIRQVIHDDTKTQNRQRRQSGTFAVEILGKRLLSCPISFAESWRRCQEGLKEDQQATDADMKAAQKSVQQETGDDREAQKREDTAAGTIGSWLKAIKSETKNEIEGIDQAIKNLNIDITGKPTIEQDPKNDARFDILCDIIDTKIKNNKKWRDDERLIVFTEYKTTLDYIVRRLRKRYEEKRILTLFGSGGKEGQDELERDLVKQAFNNPDHTVRLLIATDAASEGLDLQRTARYLLHFDCPWNPSKLEQRNGRLDRYGQTRDVTVHHFVSDQDHDLRFLAHIIRKADEIREDLGSANELFDEAAHRRLVEGEDFETVKEDLDKRIKVAQQRTTLDADDTPTTEQTGYHAPRDLEAIAAELDLDAGAMKDTLEAAMAIRAGRPQLECSEEKKTCKIIKPDLAGWIEVIDDSLRLRTGTSTRGPVARIAFCPDPFIEEVGGRRIFSPRPDVLLMHLSHPMLQKALSSLTRCRYPGTDATASRWAVRLGKVPKGADALVFLSLEELAVNDLRETFHHWVRTIAFPIKGGSLQARLPHTPAIQLRDATATHDKAHYETARSLLDEVEPDLKNFLKKHAEKLTADLKNQLKTDGEQARKQEDERYRSRQGEVSSLIAENTLAKLEKEVKKLKQDRQQGMLFESVAHLDQLDRSIVDREEEIKRRTLHYEEVRAQLEKERERILNYLLPKRYAMEGTAQVFPVSIEIRLPGGVS